MLYGYFLKLLIANRLAVIVNAAFSAYSQQTGTTMVVAIILYGLQLYADFAGYSCIAIGISDTLGYSLVQNFRPYFSGSIKEFWARWHMSLSSWLKDYVYIPLGGNRKGTGRQYINLLLTFIISGLWHGTGLQYIVWGGIHGIYQVVGRFSLSAKSRIYNKLNVNQDCFSYKLFRTLVTFALVEYAWLFFRAASVHDALSITKNIVFNMQFWNTVYEKQFLMGYDEKRFWLLLVELFILLVVDVVHEKKISITKWLNCQNKIFRWMVYITVGIVLIIGIIYNYGLEVSTFIYTQF